MGIGLGIFLLVVGAIFYFTNIDCSVLNMGSGTGNTIGIILMVAGALVLVDIAARARRRPHSPTTRGKVLRSGHPSGVRSLALMQTVAPNLVAWQHLADAVRRGGAVFEELHGQTSWAWLADRPEEEARFNAAMARRQRRAGRGGPRRA